MPLLEVRALTRSFYGVHALARRGPSVDDGRITGLIGPNGAGKTTLFNCISGLVPPDAGSVRFDGQDITRLAARPDHRCGPRPHVPDRARLSAALGAGEPAALRRRASRASACRAPALRSAARRVGARRALRERARRHRAAAESDARAQCTRAADLSGGQKKLLEIGRALMAEPRLHPARRADRRRQPDAGRARSAIICAALVADGHHLPAHRAPHGHDRAALRSRHRDGRGPPPAEGTSPRCRRRSGGAGGLHGPARDGPAARARTSSPATRAADEILKGVDLTVERRRDRRHHRPERRRQVHPAQGHRRAAAARARQHPVARRADRRACRRASQRASASPSCRRSRTSSPP